MSITSTRVQGPQQSFAVSKQIFPSIMDKGPTDPQAFYRDWDRISKVLIFDNQSVYKKFQNDFDELDDLNQLTEQIQDERNKYPPNSGLRAVLQKCFSDLCDQYQEKIEALKPKVEKAFNDYLDRQLGSGRAHLRDEICYRFSQKALTVLQSLVDKTTAKKCSGRFQKGTRCETVTLDIPKDATEPVQITAISKVSYQGFVPNGKEKLQTLISPVHIEGRAIYTIYTIRPSTGIDGYAEFSLTQ